MHSICDAANTIKIRKGIPFVLRYMNLSENVSNEWNIYVKFVQ